MYQVKEVGNLVGIQMHRNVIFLDTLVAFLLEIIIGHVFRV